jgi:hypothetical protein
MRPTGSQRQTVRSICFCASIGRRAPSLPSCLPSKEPGSPRPLLPSPSGIKRISLPESNVALPMHQVPAQQAVEPTVSLHCPTRHGDVVFQVISSFVAQSVDLSVWQDVQGLGILYLSVIAGEVNLKVCELTNVPGTP